MSQTTRETIDKLHCLKLFMGGLEAYPGANRDAVLINREVAGFMKRFETTADIVTEAESKQIQRLWEWAKVLDREYRQSALECHNVGELNGHLWNPPDPDDTNGDYR